MGGVDSVNVKAIIGFSVAEVFGLLESGGEIGTSFGHSCEDVVRCSVDNAVKTEKLVGDKTFAEDLDNGNTARDAGFEIDWSVGLVCLGDEFVTAFGEEGFIGGNEGLSCLKASLGNLK